MIRGGDPFPSEYISNCLKSISIFNNTVHLKELKCQLNLQKKETGQTK